MTGAERFADMLTRFEFAAREVPESMRPRIINQWLAEGVVGLSEQLLIEHDYGGAHDVIMMGSEMMRRLTAENISQLDDDEREIARTMVARMAGVDARLPERYRDEESEPATPDGNALSDVELRDLGIEIVTDLDSGTSSVVR